MSSTNAAMSRRDTIIATALVLVGVVLVAGAAVVIKWATPTAAPNPNAQPVFLEAPVTERDIAEAELAVRIRDALEQVESGSNATALGGFRNTGRGWFARTDSNNYQQSIAEALDAAGVLPLSDSSTANSDMLVHQCGDFFAVLAASTFPSDDEELALWDARGCNITESLVRDGPVFVTVGGR